MTPIDGATDMTKASRRRGFVRASLAFSLLALGLSWRAFGASSEFVVITPQNDAEHAFLVQAHREAAQPDRTRVRVTWPMDRYQQVWLVVCEKSLVAEEQNFRFLMWGETEGYERVISIRRLERRRMTLAETDSLGYSYLEIALPNEQMARSYLYIDFPRPVDDGGYYYSVDLAYYLDGPLGKKSEIYWEQ